ncbi:MAG: hypothetical protein ACK502_10670 [Alphaproteobacteria bacterium]|jgi:hypothetical protein
MPNEFDTDDNNPKGGLVVACAAIAVFIPLALIALVALIRGLIW